MSTVSPIPESGLDDWQGILSFRPPAAIQHGINARFGGFHGDGHVIHRIEDAYGPLSLDYYPVRIDSLPNVGGRSQDPSELLEYVRRNFNLFVDSHPAGCTFDPYEPALDTGLWAPLFLQTGFPGAVLTIKMIASPGIMIDRGSVVLGEIGGDHWTFSTLWTPQDLNHPVSGNRTWGTHADAAGDLWFYCRGADRCTTLIDDFAASVVFSAADLLWMSLQNRFAAFVNSNGGRATIFGRSAARYDWDQVRGLYFSPREAWV
jgi:hypothetical protein